MGSHATQVIRHGDGGSAVVRYNCQDRGSETAAQECSVSCRSLPKFLRDHPAPHPGVWGRNLVYGLRYSADVPVLGSNCISTSDADSEPKRSVVGVLDRSLVIATTEQRRGDSSSSSRFCGRRAYWGCLLTHAIDVAQVRDGPLQRFETEVTVRTLSSHTLRLSQHSNLQRLRQP